MKDARPAQNPAVAWRELDGAVVIIAPVENVLHYLNPTGTFLWKLADGTHTAAELAARLAGEFDVSAEQALADTLAFLEELTRKNLLQLNFPATRTGTNG